MDYTNVPIQRRSAFYMHVAVKRVDSIESFGLVPKKVSPNATKYDSERISDRSNYIYFLLCKCTKQAVADPEGFRGSGIPFCCKSL